MVNSYKGSQYGKCKYEHPTPAPPLPVQFVHPTLNRHFVSDTAWTFSMYLESMAIVPQLVMFQKQAKGIVEVLVSSRKRANPLLPAPCVPRVPCPRGTCWQWYFGYC